MEMFLNFWEVSTTNWAVETNNLYIWYW